MNSRFLSLDIFRGLTVALMILVNNQYIGSAFSQLRHNIWEGCTLTDLVFPFFIFIVGASFWFVASKRDFKCDKHFAVKIFTRSLKIFVVGVLLNWYGTFANISELRIMGVLQRIALVYLIGSFMLLWLKSRRRVIIASVLILIFYWILMGNYGDFTLENNLAGHVDLFLLGESHLYHGYGVPFEPEGILSTISAVVSMFFGYIASFWITRPDMELIVRIKNMFWIGFGLLILAMIFGQYFPINKPLWSSSYVLLTSGWAMIVWSLISYFVDCEQQGKFITRPFVVLGTNAIFAYALSAIIAKPLYSITIAGTSIPQMFKDIFWVILSEKMVTMFWGIFFVAIVWSITYPLYKRKIFIKL